MWAESTPWGRVRAIVETALRRPASEQAVFVAEACAGDDTLKSRVTCLLHSGDPHSMLESAVAKTAFSVDDGAVFSAPLDTVSLDGRIVSHYRLVERLGAGGMGVVYRARDLALGRDAALKILPQGLSAALRQRLVQEADACARLQHPAIATYFDAGEADDVAFIAMELVQGETLRERLRRSRLPTAEAVAIARCVLEALAHAHNVGILHRDIKPDNVILTGAKSAKLLDFGLAKHLQGDADASRDAGLTGRAIIGTIGYLSPEQIRAQPLDARSDVFQVGVVLHEMLTGAPPFAAATNASLLAAVLSEDPPAITTSGVSPDLARLVRNALSRSPEQRPPTAAAFLRDLDAISEEGWLPALPNTIAVVDFENLAGQDADDWIGSGIAESTGADLARTDGLAVLARDKVVQARAKLTSTTLESRAVELGQLVGCRWVLSGAYRRQRSVVEISTLLVDVASGRTIATAQFEGGLAEIFTIQDRLAELARDNLKVARTTWPTVRPSLSAYECCARAQRLFRRLEKGTLDQSLELFQRAVDLDPRYAPALIGLASVNAMKFTYTSDALMLDRAIAHARSAIEVDPRSAEPYIWLGYALTRYHRSEESARALARGRELDGTSFWCFYFGGNVLHELGRNEEALALIRRAVQLEPKAAYTWCALGSLHLDLGNTAEALWTFEQARRTNTLPDASPFPDSGGYIAECLRQLGRVAEGRAECMSGLEKIEQSDHMYRDTFRVFTLIELGVIAAEQRDAAAARTAFHQAMAHVKGRPRTLAGGFLLVQALAGLAGLDHDKRLYEEARSRLESRAELDFSWMYSCDERWTLAALERARKAVGIDRGE